MTTRERFLAALNFQPVDRLPAMEWICWWDKTVDRWREEGLPRELGREDLLRWFGIDVHEWVWVQPHWDIPRLYNRSRSLGLINSPDDYERLVAPVLAAPKINGTHLRNIAARQARGDVVVSLQLDGFFWFPREVFGIEAHLYAFFDQPDLMHRMNDELCRYNLAILEQTLEILTPDVLILAEDLSYNHGPMLSQGQFEEFITPYYQRLVPAAKARGILSMVDTDGDVTTVIPWLQQAGIEGCLPLERMAGVDVTGIRQRYPTWRMIGGFDKTIMHRGAAAVRAEWERLLPVMRTGGYVPTTDHQTPPEVSLEDFRQYVGLLQEYCRKACE